MSQLRAHMGLSKQAQPPGRSSALSRRPAKRVKSTSAGYNVGKSDSDSMGFSAVNNSATESVLSPLATVDSGHHSAPRKPKVSARITSRSGLGTDDEGVHLRKNASSGPGAPRLAKRAKTLNAPIIDLTGEGDEDLYNRESLRRKKTRK